MNRAMELAGLFAAHAVWSVSEGDTLTTILASEMLDGKPQMQRLVGQMEETVARGKDKLVKNVDGASCAVLIFDGFITLQSGKVDALLITVRDYTQGEAEVTLVVPYRPAGDAKGFAVHRPKFLEFKGAEPDFQKLGEALWRGIGKHAKGAEAWNAHLDESK